MPSDAGSASAAPPAKQWRSEQCIAIADYTAVDASEISFKKGDVISVVGKRGDASGFWEGVTTGFNVDVMTGKKNKVEKVKQAGAVSCRGLFPTCFVTSNMRAYNEPKFCDKALAIFDYAPRNAGEMELEKGDVITAIRPAALPGWWYGVKEGSGARISLESLGGPLKPNATVRKHEKIFPLQFVTSKIVVGGITCQGNTTNELPFTSGDVITVLRKWNDGWWEGTLRGSRGIFPSNLVHPNIPTTTPALFCPKCRTVFGTGTGAVGLDSCQECALSERITQQILDSLRVRYPKGAWEGDRQGGVSELDDLSAKTTKRVKVDLFADLSPEALYGKVVANIIMSKQSSVDGAANDATLLETTTVRRFQA